MSRLSDKLRTQRFDDYRFYHQSTVNQTLHLISAVIFLGCYALLFADPALAGIVGWLAMLTAADRAFLLRAERLRRRQRRQQRLQGGGEGRLQPDPQDRPAACLGQRADCAVRVPCPVRAVRSTRQAA